MKRGSGVGGGRTGRGGVGIRGGGLGVRTAGGGGLGLGFLGGGGLRGVSGRMLVTVLLTHMCDWVCCA